MKKFKRLFKRMIKTAMIDENPTFMSYLALCPTLGVTLSLQSGLGMGVSVIFVLTMSNVLVSLIRKQVPYNVRIPVYITIIATLVTVVSLLLETFVPVVYSELGIFLPLIVVNCIILGRAEAFASKKKKLDSLVDGLTMGMAFTVSLSVIGLVRELLATGKVGLLGLNLFYPEDAVGIFNTGAGAFFTVGLLAWVFNHYKAQYDKNKKPNKRSR